ncbi:DinB family protein [Gracilibacillus salitolerans]|uniref:DinB family protein n=1 Tax=Gracilibacillus salitolerans TaxID=2663022 RepID=A0A5Q2TGD6_9BACI|nr:DinB family protein [Gracilibacillus salitolerans]QGH33675.1 DinB family protein [Gracilibacillus salitolerans]
MKEIDNLIEQFEQFNSWVNSLEKVDDALFFTPINEGKWTPAEIITHITYWDRYILEELMPKMKKDAKIASVAFDVINQPASKHALSGVTKTQLIQEQIEARNYLVRTLEEKSEEEFFATFILNGEEIDQYSGYPHSLLNYISAFVWHDNHHKEQIEEYLNRNQVSNL